MSGGGSDAAENDAQQFVLKTSADKTYKDSVAKTADKANTCEVYCLLCCLYALN